MNEVGIIGFGRFGQLAAVHLKNAGMNVFVSDIEDKSMQAEKLNVKFVSFNETVSKEFIIICVPISAFEETLIKAVPLLKKDSIVFDVCSVKEFPARKMRELIPENIECIATHPLFGPDTANDDLDGLSIVLCPVRTSRFEKVKAFLNSLNLNIIEISPQEHDEQISRSLLMIHFIGKALLKLNVENVVVKTKTHERLLELVNIVRNDSEQLFKDMNCFNSFSAQARKKLIEKLINIDDSLKEGL